jgi:GTP pyrophosphokinase
VHTTLGHRCRGARVDGQMVPLDYELANGQRVEIVAAKQGGPSRDWLNPDLGYVHSHRARTKVRQWFKAQQHEETVAQGRALVERELARLGHDALKLDAVAAKAGFDKTDEFFAAYARDEINRKQVHAAIHARRAAGALPAAPRARGRHAQEPRIRARAAASWSSAWTADDGLARCCKPAPPDPIVGFVTRGKGITVHRASCANVGAHARARARAADRGELGRAARRGLFPSTSSSRRSDRRASARHLRSAVAREDQRDRRQHADAPAPGPHGVHAAKSRASRSSRAPFCSYATCAGCSWRPALTRGREQALEAQGSRTR